MRGRGSAGCSLWDGGQTPQLEVRMRDAGGVDAPPPRRAPLWCQGSKLLAGLTGSPCPETSLVVQWLRPHNPNTGGLGSIPVRFLVGARFHMLQLRVYMSQLKILCVQ